MPGNDFEKQVQQKMDELQFVPSDAVWPAVERQITEKKKRRVIVWLPFLFLLMGGAAWMYFSNSTNNISKKQPEDIATAKTAGNNKDLDSGTKDSAPVNDESKKTIQPVPLKNNMAGKPAVAANRVSADKEKSEKNKNTNLSQNSIGTNSLPAERSKIKLSSKDNHVADTSDDETAASLTASTGKRLNKKANNINGLKAAGTKNTSIETAGKETVIKDEVAVNETTTVNKQHDKSQATENSNEAVVSVPVIDSAANALATAKPVAKDSIQKSTIADSSKAIAKNKVSNKAKKNIEWGAQVSAGVSSISKGFSGIFSGGQSNDINSFSNVQVGRPSNSIPNNAAAVAPPSAVTSGFAFSAGVFLNKPFKKGFSIRTGLNYHYYSTNMQVGTKIDTGILAGFYRTGTASQYTNQFHFIELPVTVQQSVGKKSRFSINAGLSLSVLAASKVLLYDASKISYTAEKSYLNKMQFNVLAGFSYRLIPQSLPLEIGPQFNLGISNIYNKELYGSKHLFFAGIRASVFFHKK